VRRVLIVALHHGIAVKRAVSSREQIFTITCNGVTPT